MLGTSALSARTEFSVTTTDENEWPDPMGAHVDHANAREHSLIRRSIYAIA